VVQAVPARTNLRDGRVDLCIVRVVAQAGNVQITVETHEDVDRPLRSARVMQRFADPDEAIEAVTAFVRSFS
jgi:hypothetical protein